MKRDERQESADEEAATRQIEADQLAAGYVPEPLEPIDFDALPF